jgi:hypothetical protein
MKLNIQEISSHIPQGIVWATVNNVAEWMLLDHKSHAHLLGRKLGLLCAQSRFISYKGKKVRAWYFGFDWRDPREWTNAQIREELDLSENTLQLARMLP